MGESTALERLLRRERTLTIVGLLALCVLAWVYVLSGAGLGMSAWDMTTLSLFPHKSISAAAADMGGVDMGGMDMAGMQMGGGMETGRSSSPAAWTPQAWLLTVAMWWTMMVAMMTPSATPIILLYSRVRRTADGRSDAATSGVFAAGYLLVWLGFSLCAATLQWGLQRLELLSPAAMGSQSRWLSAGVLLAAGAYQLSPLKNSAFAAAARRPPSSRATGGQAGAALCGLACCTAPTALVAAGS